MTSKINRLVLNQQFKKAYSVLTNAVNSAIFDMGGSIDCFYDAYDLNLNRVRSGCYSFWSENLIKKLKIVKVCKGNAYAQGCVPDYDFETHFGCSWFGAENIKNSSFVAVTADGMIVIPYSSYSEAYPVLAFDVNGKKGPNKAGVDIYSLYLYKRDNNTFFLGASYYRSGSEIKQDSITSCLPVNHRDAVQTMSEIMK